MIRYDLIALFSLGLFCCDTNKDRIVSVEIRKMDDIFSMLPSPISCGELEKFGSEVDTIKISDAKKMFYIQSQLYASRPAGKEYSEVDVRAKIIITYESGKKENACLGTTGIFRFNDKLMRLKSDELIDSLNSW